MGWNVAFGATAWQCGIRLQKAYFAFGPIEKFRMNWDIDDARNLLLIYMSNSLKSLDANVHWGPPMRQAAQRAS